MIMIGQFHNWLKNFHNEFHGGVERGPLEVVEDCVEVESKWKTRSSDPSTLTTLQQSQTLVAQGGMEDKGYEALYWHWIKECARVCCHQVPFKYPFHYQLPGYRQILV